MVTNQRVPPLKSWLLIAAIALGIVVLMIMLPSQERQEDKRIGEWLRENSQAENMNVVVLGTSLTGCGLDSANAIEKKIEAAAGKKIRVLKIWKLNASPETFARLSTQIEKAHPSLVVVESNILFYSFIKNKGWPEYVQRLRNLIFQRNAHYRPDERPVIVKREASQLEAFRSGLVDSSQLSNFKQLLERLSAKGARIALLNFPLESSLESRKWSGSDTTIYRRNLRFLQERINIISNNEKALWGPEYYIDHAHLNQEGQQRQTDIFFRMVNTQLAGR